MARVIERFRTTILAVLAALSSAACVPEGPSTVDAGTTAKPVAPVPLATHRPKAVEAPIGSTALPLLTAPFEDTFERAELGPDWNALSAKWRITNGRLCVRNARNHGIWLNRRIPANARIEFDAVAESAEGDIKAELWGDGATGATGASYTNATSYLTIFGGWKNTKHVLARLDEHGADRMELDVDPQSDDERARPVAAEQPYHFKIERVDGRTVEWWVNGISYFRLSDPDPLTGAGLEHVGFNDWDAPVCFDNLKVTPL
jgi:hypothetical protein